MTPDNPSNPVMFLLWLFITLFIYFLPLIVALARRSRRIWAILLLNLFAGWNPLGWLGSFIWAVIDPQEKEKSHGITR